MTDPVIASLVSRRQDLYRHTPCRGLAWEFCTGTQAAELVGSPPLWRDPPDLLVRRCVITDAWREATTAIGADSVDIVLILPGIGDTPALCSEARRILKPGGWLAIAVEEMDAQGLVNYLGTLGYEPLSARPWNVGRGAYAFARRPWEAPHA